MISQSAPFQASPGLESSRKGGEVGLPLLWVKPPEGKTCKGAKQCPTMTSVLTNKPTALSQLVSEEDPLTSVCLSHYQKLCLTLDVYFIDLFANTT